MRKIFYYITYTFITLTLFYCSPSVKIVSTNGPTISEILNEPDSSLKTSVTVERFKNQTGYNLGCGLEAMLSTSLFNTNKFIVIEREFLKDILLEHQLNQTGVINPETAVQFGKLEAADFLVYGEVTEFTPKVTGVATNIAGIQQSHMAINIRIVDTKTTRIVSSTTVEGTTTDYEIDTGILSYINDMPSLAIWVNTPMGNAIRICIDKAVEYIVNNL